VALRPNLSIGLPFSVIQLRHFNGDEWTP